MKITSILAEIFFPWVCVCCGKSLKRGVVCRTCFMDIPINKTFFCAECGQELAIAMRLCHPRAACVVGGAGPYGNATLKTLVHDLKFRTMRDAAEPLAELMATFILAAMPQISNYILVPIPLSQQRQRERGYNQTVDIATHLGVKLSLPVATDMLMKVRHTKPQVTTGDLEERKGNLAGCFAVKGIVADKKILLIDDVTTSGSTFLEAAKVLHTAGARKVLGIAAAKA